MCFTNVNEAGIRYRYFMYSTNKCTDFNKNITLERKEKKCPHTHCQSVTYSWDLIIMFRLTYPRTACNLLLYSDLILIFKTNMNALPELYSTDLIHMFRLTYTRTACTCTLLLRQFHYHDYVQTNLPAYCL